LGVDDAYTLTYDFAQFVLITDSKGAKMTPIAALTKQKEATSSKYGYFDIKNNEYIITRP
jgi:hypothetical protein